jgi:hypothetical protein
LEQKQQEQQQQNRQSKYNEAPNCSIVQIREGQVCVFGRRLYTTPNTEINYREDKVRFYEVDGIHSLNQSVDNPKPKTYHLPINLAFEIFAAFKEIDQENLRKIERLFSE